MKMSFQLDSFPTLLKVPKLKLPLPYILSLAKKLISILLKIFFYPKKERQRRRNKKS